MGDHDDEKRRRDAYQCGPGDVDESAGLVAASGERTDGDEDAWSEAGSDELMDFQTLVQIRAQAAFVEAERARKIARRGE